MHPHIIRRPAPGKNLVLANSVVPRVRHERAGPNAPAAAAARQRIKAKASAAGGANHARHHVSRQTQA